MSYFAQTVYTTKTMQWVKKVIVPRVNLPFMRWICKISQGLSRSIVYSIEFYEFYFYEYYKLAFITFLIKEEEYEPKLHNCREGNIFTQK